MRACSGTFVDGRRMEHPGIVPPEVIPKSVRRVSVDFYFDLPRLWALDLPVEELSVTQLIWHFAVPFLWKEGCEIRDGRRRFLEQKFALRHCGGILRD